MLSFSPSLPSKKKKGCELVVAAYNHNAIMSDDLIGSGGTDLRGLHGAGAGAGERLRRIQLFDKNDEPAGHLILDVISVDKEGIAGAAAAPAVGAPVGAGAGLGAGAAASGVGARGGGEGVFPAAAPTTPGAEGEARRTPSGPSAVEAERERREREAQGARAMKAETKGVATTGAAAPEGEGIVERIRRATGAVRAPREPSPERRAPPLAAAPGAAVAAAPAVPVSTAAMTMARTVPAPRQREEGQVRSFSSSFLGFLFYF